MEYIIAAVAIIIGIFRNDIRYFYLAAACSILFTTWSFIKDIMKIHINIKNDPGPLAKMFFGMGSNEREEID